MPIVDPEKVLQQRDYWRQCWVRALNNMPSRSKKRRGQATLLQILLGYPHLDPKGRNCAAQHYYTSMIRGSRPRNPDKRRLLEVLAGPHGTTYVRAIAILKNLDLSRYKYWPHH